MLDVKCKMKNHPFTIQHRTSNIIFFLCLTINVSAQFVNSIGLTAGVTYGNERWKDKVLADSEKKNYLLGYNASLQAEFFSGDFLRWVSEFQFNQKGSIDKEPAGKYTTKMDYGCFNNYLKIRKELLRIIPYVLIGPRIEYKIDGGSARPRVPGAFIPLHVSLAAGVGVEFVAYGPFKFFVEGFYNPDLTKAYSTSKMDITNNAFELRLGVKYVF